MANSELEIFKIEHERTRAEKAEQDRDSWKSSFLITRDGANKRLKELEDALSLALYYVEGDATYEGLKEQIKRRFGIDLSPGPIDI